VKLTPQIDMLEMAARALGPLKDDVAFLGGCIVGILITDNAAPAPRPTNDVDALVEATTYVDLKEMEKRVRAQGFEQEPGETVICRWRGHGLVLDLMPTEGEILGFSNQWYPSAMEHAVATVLPSGTGINVIDAPHFLATKLEAFNDRGAADIYGSHDLEDVIAVIDGRPELLEEMESAPTDVREFVRKQIENLFRKLNIQDAVEGHLAASGSSVQTVLSRMQEMV
jgi:hypothetical protein